MPAQVAHQVAQVAHDVFAYGFVDACGHDPTEDSNSRFASPFAAPGGRVHEMSGNWLAARSIRCG